VIFPLALNDMGGLRVKQYKLLMASFPANVNAPEIKDGKLSDSNPVNLPFQYKFNNVFAVLKGVGSGKPSDHFIIDYSKKTLKDAGSASLTFN